MSRAVVLRGAGAVAAFALLTVAASAAAADTVERRCYRNDQVTVLGRANDQGAGTILTLRKSTPTLRADCVFEDRPTDIVIGRSDEAYYYVALEGPYLILDAGTSPDRGLAVFDGRTGKPILQAPYSVSGPCDPTSGCQSDEFRHDGSSLTFWRGTRDIPDAANCPDIQRIRADSLTPVVEERTVFHFATAKAQSLEARRCVPSQGGVWQAYRIRGVLQR